MKILTTLLLSVMFIIQSAAHDVQQHHTNLRAIPISATSRRRLIPKWPYAFLVSHIEKSNNQDWCITAKYGVTDGSNVGLDRCDFQNAPQSQLLLLDDIGKIHCKLDPTQCLVVDQGSRTDLGGARVKFCACDEVDADYTTFEHNRSTDVIRVHDDPKCCIKPTGNGADVTDTMRTELCNETNSCFIYDYVEHNCEKARWNDVECCNDADCNADADTTICKNYTCVCRHQCCKNTDCAIDEVCTSNHTCIVGDTSRTDDCTGECCKNDDCPTGYTCEANVCMTPAFFLASTIDYQDWCVAVNRGVDEFADVGSERCDFVSEPRSQLWHEDTHHKIRSDMDVTRCMLVGEGTNIFSGLYIKIASCNVNTFLYNSETKRIHLGEDVAYCLTSNQDVTDGMVCGKPCDYGDSFGFTMKLA